MLILRTHHRTMVNLAEEGFSHFFQFGLVFSADLDRIFHFGCAKKPGSFFGICVAEFKEDSSYFSILKRNDDDESLGAKNLNFRLIVLPPPTYFSSSL